MKNNKIYKIITAVVMITLFFSIATVNASAFEHEYEDGGYVDIFGDQDGDEFGSIYGPDYVLLRCEFFDAYGFESEVDPEYFTQVWELEVFLSELEDGSFVSPNGDYSASDYTQLKYLEIFLLNPSNARLLSCGIYPVGIESTLILPSGIYVHEFYPSITYAFGCNYDIFEQYSYGIGLDSFFVVACYFDDCSPYDGFYNKAPDLIENLETLEGYIQRLEENNRDLSIELNTEKAVHEQRVNDLLEELEAAESKLFEMENANALDQVFTGTSQGLVSLIREVAKLGYSPSPGVNITIGGLLTIGVIAAFVAALIGIAFGGKKRE